MIKKIFEDMENLYKTKMGTCEYITKEQTRKFLATALIKTLERLKCSSYSIEARPGFDIDVVDESDIDKAIDDIKEQSK